jgi:hypothetical protein
MKERTVEFFAQVSGGLSAVDTDAVRLVRIRFVCERTTESRIRVTIERSVVQISPSSGATVAQLIRKGDENLREEFADARGEAAAKTLEPVWVKLSQGWLVSDPGNFAGVAQTVTDFRERVHRLVLGEPVEFVGVWVGLPGPVALAFGDFADFLPLPCIDSRLSRAKTCIEIVGVVAGALTGHGILAIGCLKMLAHDQFTHIIGEEVKRALRGLGTAEMSPEDPDVRAVVPPPEVGVAEKLRRMTYPGYEHRELEHHVPEHRYRTWLVG